MSWKLYILSIVAYHIQMHLTADIHGIKGCPGAWQIVEGNIKLQQTGKGLCEAVLAKQQAL